MGKIRRSRNDSSNLLLRARFVLPINQPPIRDGVVLVAGKRIAAIGRWRGLTIPQGTRVVDLGSKILLPGLVNAHCHLDYTNMAGEFRPPKLFTDWLKLITTAKSLWSVSDYRESWRNGADMLLRSGTTTVGDIEAVPELLPELWRATPLRVLSFLELIGITARRRPAAIVEDAVARIATLKHGRCRAGLSPHAPYSTLPELLRLAGQTARRRRWPLCVHVAESSVEFEMFRHGRGYMYEWLKKSGRDVSDCGTGSPVEHLLRCGVLNQRLLAVHANYLGRDDAEILASRKVSVAHCPRSHAYFGHQRFQLKRLLKAGVNICLGTDSLASTYQRHRQPAKLDLFEEMRALAQSHASISAKTILEMATINGARALGLKGRVGELAPGSRADLIGIPFAGKVADIHPAVLHHQGDVACSMIDGRWAIRPESDS